MLSKVSEIDYFGAGDVTFISEARTKAGSNPVTRKKIQALKLNSEKL